VSKVNQSIAQTGIVHNSNGSTMGLKVLTLHKLIDLAKKQVNNMVKTHSESPQMWSTLAWCWLMRFNLQQSTFYDGNGVFLSAKLLQSRGKSTPLRPPTEV
jgi:hypothetical protein